MKLLENSDAEKKRLIETSARHKKELEQEINSISENTEKMVTNVLLIGGALALTYFTVTQLVGSKSKKKKKKHRKREEEYEDEELEEDDSGAPGVLSHVGDIVITQLTMALLEFAKEKLSDYLESRQTANEDEDDEDS